MYEFHGWATIQETASEADAGNLDRSLEQIRAWIAKLGWSSGLLNLQAMNGTYFLSLGGFTNRKAQEAKDIMELFDFIGNAAPGSYGLLYIRDDEHAAGLDNEFRVHVLAKGKLSEHKDPFLSPCIPVIEDEVD